MNEQNETTNELAKIDEAVTWERQPDVHPPQSPRELRTQHVGELLREAYLKGEVELTEAETTKLCADFSDDIIRIRPHDGAPYIPHIYLRERLWSVFGPLGVREIVRDKFMKAETNEVAVDLVLLIHGAYASEGIGTAEYIPSNENADYGDVVESAWSNALMRCCKKIGVGTQMWRPGYCDNWKIQYAETYGKTLRNGKHVTMWRLKGDEAQRQLVREQIAAERPTATEWEEPKSEFQKAKAIMDAADWRTVPVHFGKNKGTALGDLTPQQLHWYAHDWLDAKLSAPAESPSKDDKILVGALVTYRREHEYEKAKQSELITK